MSNATTRRQTALKFRVPVACNLAQLFPDLKDRCDAAYVLDTIHRRMMSWRIDEIGFVRLMWELLARYARREHLQRIIDTLVQAGVIEIDPSYSEGRYSKGYRLTTGYMETRDYTCRDRRLAKRLRDYREGQEEKLLPVHRWLRGNLWKLRFDHKGAAEIIATLEPEADSPLGVGEYRQIVREMTKRLKGARRTAIIRDPYGRVHTPVTNLPTELRCCLSVYGQHLVGIDLRNSQPLILGIVAENYVTSKNTRFRMKARRFEDRHQPYVRQEIDHMRKKIDNNKNKGKLLSNMSTICCEYSENQGEYENCQVIPEDVIRYQELCEGGTLYEYLQPPGVERDEVKRRLFRDVLFGRPCVRNSLTERFAREFPTVDRILRELKTRAFEHAAHLMQSYESTLVIAIICDRIRKERPELPIYTIHDSILTTPQHVEYVRGVMLEEFGKIGVTPQLKVEWYAPGL